MSVKTRPLLVLTVSILVFAGTAAGATVLDSGFEGDDPEWYRYDDGAASFTYDTDYTNDVYSGDEAGRARRGSGLCGYGGIAHDFSLDSSPDQLKISFRAWLESWGPGGSIFVKNSSGYYELWVMRDDTQYGSGSGGWTSWMTETFDVSGVGKNFTLVLGNQDTTGYCNYGDHGWEIRADEVSVTTAVTGVQPVCSGCDTPTDPDSDGLYEDVDGDRMTDSEDVQLLADKEANGKDLLPDSQTQYFDFKEDGVLDFYDVTALSQEMPLRVCEGCSSPTDPDGDNLYEDVDGDGNADDEDATVLFQNLDSVSPEWFDFNNDSSMTTNDPTSLAEELHPDLACSDVSSDSAVQEADADDNGAVSLSEVQDAANEYDNGNITPAEMVFTRFAWESDCEVEMPAPDANLSDADEIFGADDTIVYGGNTGVGYAFYSSRADEVNEGLDLGVVSELSFNSSRKDDSNLILIGDSDFNDYTGELVSSGQIEDGSHLAEHEAEAVLVENAFATGKHVLVLRGGGEGTVMRALSQDVNDILKDGMNPSGDMHQVSLPGSDLSLAYSDMLFSSAKVVVPSQGKEEFEQDAARDLAAALNLETVMSSEVTSTMKSSENLVIVGGPAVNSLTAELADEGKAWTVEEYRDAGEGTARINLVPDAFSDGNHAVIVSGYDTDAVRLAADEFELIMDDEGTREELEGRQTVTMKTLQNRDLAVEDLYYERLDNGSYRVTTQVRNTGVEVKAREDFDLRFIPPRDYEVLDDHGAVKEKYTLENGLNEISWILNPDFVSSGTELSLDTGENTSVTLGGEAHTISVLYLLSPGEAVTVIDGQRYTLEEGSTVTVSGQKLKVQEIIQTGETSGVVLFAVGSGAQGTVEVGIELDSGDRLDEVDEENNRLVETIEVGENQTGQGTIELYPGWNMISSPYSDAGLYVEDVTDDCVLESVSGEVAWQLEGGAWTHPSAVAPTEGIFVKSPDDCTASIERDRWSEGDAPSADVLEAGWNVVSVPEPMPLSQIAGTCEFQDFQGTPVWHYQAEFGNWQRLGQSGVNLYPARGYYVTVSDRCELSSGGDQESPPAPTGNVVSGLMGLLG